jgi:hypothetical protein
MRVKLNRKKRWGATSQREREREREREKERRGKKEQFD